MLKDTCPSYISDLKSHEGHGLKKKHLKILDPFTLGLWCPACEKSPEKFGCWSLL